jgi:hypothetical protein
MDNATHGNIWQFGGAEGLGRDKELPLSTGLSVTEHGFERA